MKIFNKKKKKLDINFECAIATAISKVNIHCYYELAKQISADTLFSNRVILSDTNEKPSAIFTMTEERGMDPKEPFYVLYFSMKAFLEKYNEYANTESIYDRMNEYVKAYMDELTFAMSIVIKMDNKIDIDLDSNPLSNWKNTVKLFVYIAEIEEFAIQKYISSKQYKNMASGPISTNYEIADDLTMYIIPYITKYLNITDKMILNTDFNSKFLRFSHTPFNPTTLGMIQKYQNLDYCCGIKHLYEIFTNYDCIEELTEVKPNKNTARTALVTHIMMHEVIHLCQFEGWLQSILERFDTSPEAIELINEIMGKFESYGTHTTYDNEEISLFENEAEMANKILMNGLIHLDTQEKFAEALHAIILKHQYVRSRESAHTNSSPKLIALLKR